MSAPMREEHGLLDEGLLRRALRLDAAELPPRLDPALLAAAAAQRTTARGPILTVAAVAFAGGWVWSEIVRGIAGALLAAGGVDPVAVAVDVVTAVAISAAPVAEAVAQPAVPLAVMTAAAIAFLHERGRAHATAKA
jgi:hypothetical protein